MWRVEHDDCPRQAGRLFRFSPYVAFPSDAHRFHFNLTDASCRFTPTVSAAPGFSVLNQTISTVNPDIFNIIKREKTLRMKSIQLIPTEKFTSRSVRDAVGFIMINKYSKFYPGARSYGGNEVFENSDRLYQQDAGERASSVRWKPSISRPTCEASTSRLCLARGVTSSFTPPCCVRMPASSAPTCYTVRHLQHRFMTDERHASASSVSF